MHRDIVTRIVVTATDFIVTARYVPVSLSTCCSLRFYGDMDIFSIVLLHVHGHKRWRLRDICASADGHIKFWKKMIEGINFVKHFKAHLGACPGLPVGDRFVSPRECSARSHHFCRCRGGDRPAGDE